MSHKLLRADEAFWRPSNQMRIENTDLGTQLEAEQIGARLWRLRPGQASTWHRHRTQEEVYLLLEGRGRVRLADETLTMDRLDSLRVEAGALRQLFNDGDEDQLWLVFGAPREAANTLEMTQELLDWMYPEGPRSLPPELGGGRA